MQEFTVSTWQEERDFIHPVCSHPYSIKSPKKTTYYLNGKPHRIGAPAVECLDGEWYWAYNGILNRFDGPAVRAASRLQGYTYFLWYINGKEYTEKRFNRIMGVFYLMLFRWKRRQRR